MSWTKSYSEPVAVLQLTAFPVKLQRSVNFGLPYQLEVASKGAEKWPLHARWTIEQVTEKWKQFHEWVATSKKTEQNFFASYLHPSYIVSVTMWT